jgi:hypothetical protein
MKTTVRDERLAWIIMKITQTGRMKSRFDDLADLVEVHNRLPLSSSRHKHQFNVGRLWERPARLRSVLHERRVRLGDGGLF